MARSDRYKLIWAPRKGGVWGQGQGMSGDRALAGLLEEALSGLGEGDSPLRSRVLGRLATELYWLGSLERSASLSQEATDIARKVGDKAALAYALDARYFTIFGPETTEERLAIATEMMLLAEEVRDRERAHQAHLWRCISFMEQGDIPAADLELEAQDQLAEELRQPAQLWFTEVVRAMRALLEGRFEEGERLAQQALAIGQSAMGELALSNFGVQLFVLRRAQGRLHELEGGMKGFVAQYPAVPGWRAGLAYLYAELGREAEARAELEHLAANDFTDLPRDYTWLLVVALVSEVCAFLADARRAATLYELLLPYAELNVVAAPAVCSGSAARYLGLLAATMSRWREAAQHFEEALKMNAKIGAKQYLANTQQDYASMLIDRDGPGDRDKAFRLLTEAIAMYREIGMPKHVEMAEAMLGEVS